MIFDFSFLTQIALIGLVIFGIVIIFRSSSSKRYNEKIIIDKLEHIAKLLEDNSK